MESVDMSQLAARMLTWEQMQLRANELRAVIEATVMRIGETQTVGNTRATYSSGRKTYDYAMAAMMCPRLKDSIAQQFTVTPEPQTDWRKICEHVGVDKASIPFTQTEPSVTVKLLK